MYNDDSDLRTPFPFLEACTYLDTASAGLSSPGQGAAVADFFDGAKKHGILGRPAWRGKLAELQSRLAVLFGVSAEEVLFLSNTSESINLVAHSISWCAGDNIVVAEDEYPTLVGAWHIAERAGVRIVRVPIPDEIRREAALLGAMDARTRVLVASQVHWGTGTMIDLYRAGTACRANGTLFVVDGTQAWGAVPVNLSAVDVYSAAAFKWVLSGFGLAICIVRKEAQAKMDSAYRGVMNMGPAPHHLQYSHVNYPGIYALDTALGFLDRCGWGRIYARTAHLSRYLHGALGERGFAVAAPIDALAGIVAFKVANPEDLAHRLEQRNIKVTGRGERLRISPHFYNNQHDLDRLVEAVTELGRPA